LRGQFEMSGSDHSTIVASVAVEMTKRYLEKLEAPLADLVKRKVIPHLKTFEPYLKKTLKRCNAVRVLADRDRVYALPAIYVKGSYKSGTSVADDDQLSQRLRDGGRIIVQGLGGIGKTILLKYIWLSVFSEPQGKIPVYLELRRINDITATHLPSYIATILSSTSAPLSTDAFQELAARGRFIFIFDGFDEVIDEQRSALEEQILELAYEYPDCGMLMSSRKDDRFLGWEQFDIYEAQPFGQGQIEEVISKVSFDEEIKGRFLNEIIGNNFRRHSDFLSTPLLAIMMLMTYRQFADVPEKIHIFYKYAFQTLFSLHDASKESFKRRRKSVPDEEGFAKVFSIISLISYLEQKVSFSVEDFASFIERARKYVTFKVDVEKFSSDAIQSVNLLYREGNTLSFAHRSFQEYFAAFAVVNFFFDKIPELVARIQDRQGDAVLMMMYEMNSQLIEDKLLVKQYRDHAGDIEKFLRPIDSLPRYLKDMNFSWMFILQKGKRNNVRLMQSMVMSTAHPAAQVGRMVQQFLPTQYDSEVGRSHFVKVPPGVHKLAKQVAATITEWDDETESLAVCFVEFDRKDDAAPVSLTNVQMMSRSAAGVTDEQLDELKPYIMEWISLARAEVVFAKKKLREIQRREKLRASTFEEIL
jgi:hypothetical protein